MIWLQLPPDGLESLARLVSPLLTPAWMEGLPRLHGEGVWQVDAGDWFLREDARRPGWAILHNRYWSRRTTVEELLAPKLRALSLGVRLPEDWT